MSLQLGMKLDEHGRIIWPPLEAAPAEPGEATEPAPSASSS